MPCETESDFLALDDHTLKDLEIFGSESGEESLFEFCNLSRTEGGARVLRRRMAQPWSDAGKIRATQQAISFIQANRQAFTLLPSAFLTGRVEHYSNEILPTVTGEGTLDFGLGAFGIWANGGSHFLSIIRGVQVACRLIHTLRRFIDQADLQSPAGELEPLLDDMGALLSRPGLFQVPDEVAGGRVWQILRLDQAFRLHETDAMTQLLQLIYEIDALVSMADVTHDKGFVLPQVEEGSLRVSATGLVHPFLVNPVANPAEIDQSRRVLFLTGPNMAGKTTYLRAFATALYLAHLGMGVPAISFTFVPAQRLFSSISLNDDLRHGISYFRAEALRVKAIAEAIAAGYRVVAIMDEPFKGTNVKDALDASLAILERFSTKADCLFLFSSHLIELSEQLKSTDHIDRRYFEAEEGEGRLRFDYRIRPGVSSQRLGMRVLREEGVFQLLDTDEEDKP